MYRNGHYGVALLVYAPVGFVLYASGDGALALGGGAVMVSLATLPDLDGRIPLLAHRGPTHSVVFALLVGAVVGALASLLHTGLDPQVAGGFGFAVGTLAVLAHLLADALTPMGVRPFWPVSDRSYTLSLSRAGNPVANWLLLVAGVAVTLSWLGLLGRP